MWAVILSLGRNSVGSWRSPLVRVERVKNDGSEIDSLYPVMDGFV